MTEPTIEPGPPTPSTSRRQRVTSASAVIGLLVGLLAFAIVVQVHSNSQGSQLSTARQDDLVRILSDLTAREQRLRVEIAKLEQTRSQLSSGAQGREAALAEARRRAEELGILAGTLAAQGPGLRIHLVPGERGLPATTVLEAIEELRGSGAEAMQISGGDGHAVRIVASTAFVDGAAGLVVDDQPLAVPYTITAIGPSQTMRTALTIPGGAVDSVQHDGGTVSVDEPDEVHVDALYTGGELRYAQPVP
ncbi:MAG: DUF881 domain-containing protein [Micromonosporaceae bacterium]